ncbi:MAG: hypothetical protein IPH76_10645 [Xanthomonadales bacterium]|nr:hypothetical protein [Xanthomonadales bacterium]
MITGASLAALAHPAVPGLVKFGRTPFWPRTEAELRALGIPAASASLYVRAMLHWRRARAAGRSATTRAADAAGGRLSGVGHTGALAAFNRSLSNRVLDLTPADGDSPLTPRTLHAAKAVLTLNDQLVMEALALVHGRHRRGTSRYVRAEHHEVHVARRAYAAQVDLQSVRARAFTAAHLLSIPIQRIRDCIWRTHRPWPHWQNSFSTPRCRFPVDRWTACIVTSMLRLT